jgi:hypothetical protein
MNNVKPLSLVAAWYVLFLQSQWKAVPQFFLCISAAFGKDWINKDDVCEI